MSRGPKLLQDAETDQCKKAMGGYQKEIKVISQMNDSSDNVKILILLFQGTLCLTIPTVGKGQILNILCAINAKGAVDLKRG